MTGYTTRQVAEIVGLPPRRIREWARGGLLEAARGPGNRYRFTFQDIVLLRTARALQEEEIPPHRIRTALRSLKDQLPDGRSLSAVRISAQGERVLVRDADAVWEPETGQVTFDFSVGELAGRAAPLAGPAPAEGEMSADDWFDRAYDLEAVAPEQARAAYHRALEAEPAHLEALLNLGRLLHEGGDVEGAEALYRRAEEAEPGSALAAFNLGVALEDLGRLVPAEAAYRRALEADPGLPDAHYNLARILEERGRVPEAVRHLAIYRRLRSG